MTKHETAPKGRPAATPSRGNVTPSGYKNVRVFVPKSLHFRLVSHSAASEMSLQDFVVAWLERAVPISATLGPAGQSATEPASDQGKAHDAQGGRCLAEGPDGARGPQAAAARPGPT